MFKKNIVIGLTMFICAVPYYVLKHSAAPDSEQFYSCMWFGLAHSSLLTGSSEV